MSSRQAHVCLWSLVVLAFAIRIAYCAAGNDLGHTSYPTEYWGHEYIITAERLLEHGTMVSPLPTDDSGSTPSCLMPPGYVGLVAGVYRLFGTNTFAATLILQVINALSTSLAVPVVFLVARRISGPPAAWLAAVIATVNPALIGLTPRIWDTSLFALCAIVCVWVSLRLSSAPTGWRSAFGFGLLLGGVALLNPALTITYPFLVLWSLRGSSGWRLRQVVPGVLASLCGWLVLITPWTVRNYIQFGELTYIRGGLMLQLWLGVCPEADSDGAAVFRRQFPYGNPDVQARVASIGEQAFIKECGERAKVAIRADPWRLARLVAIRAVDYWAGTVFTHAPAGGSGWPPSAPRAAATLFMSGEVLLIALCLLTRRRTGTDLGFLLAIVVSFSITYCLTHVEAKYRVPTEPSIAIIAAALAIDLLRSRTRGPSGMDNSSRLTRGGHN